MRKLLTEVCDIQYGYPFDSSKFSDTEGMPLIRIRDVVRGYSETFTTEEYNPIYVVNSGDILIGMDGEFNIAKWGKIPALLNQRVCRLIPKNIINKNYLYYYMFNVLKYIEAKTSFVTVKHLSAKELNKVEIYLPKMEQQVYISDTLDKINNLINKQSCQLIMLDKLVKSRFIEMFGDPISNSMNLPIMQGNDIFKVANGKFVIESKRFNSGIPAYGGNGISWYTDATLIQDDTIVIGRVGFQSGNVHFAKGPLWITDNAMYIANLNTDRYDLFFMYYLMKYIDFTRFQDSGDLKKITQKPFLSMKYIMPTLLRQREYVDFVSKTDKSKYCQEKCFKFLRYLAKNMRQELL